MWESKMSVSPSVCKLNAIDDNKFGCSATCTQLPNHFSAFISALKSIWTAEVRGRGREKEWAETYSSGPKLESDPSYYSEDTAFGTSALSA